MKRGSLRGTVGTSLSSQYGASLAVPGGGVVLCWNWRSPSRFPWVLWVWMQWGVPSLPAAGARCVPAARKGWKEAPQPLGGSFAAATSNPAPRSRTPAWSGLCLRLGIALRLALRPRSRRPPGLRSIAASRLRPPPRAHLPARLAAPPSAPRATAPLSVPLGARPCARALARRARCPSRRADLPRATGRRFSLRGGSSARGAPTPLSGPAGS